MAPQGSGPGQAPPPQTRSPQGLGCGCHFGQTPRASQRSQVPGAAVVAATGAAAVPCSGPWCLQEGPVRSPWHQGQLTFLGTLGTWLGPSKVMTGPAGHRQHTLGTQPWYSAGLLTCVYPAPPARLPSGGWGETYSLGRSAETSTVLSRLGLISQNGEATAGLGHG